MAEQLVVAVARTQDLRTPSAPYFGAIAGSFPIYGRYAPLQYPSWGHQVLHRCADREETDRQRTAASQSAAALWRMSVNAGSSAWPPLSPACKAVPLRAAAPRQAL
jgi:hypothetical protein